MIAPEPLRACPFCGGAEIEIQTGTPDREGVPTNLFCVTCGAAGPFVYQQEGEHAIARAQWNKRAIR